MKKKLFSATVFLLIFAMLFASLQELLKPKWGEGTGGARETLNANGFYSEPDNSIDVMFFGSSYCFFAVSPLTMWQEYGYTSYVRGSANQSMFLTYYTLKESLKTQTPKVVVIEIGQVANEFDPVKDEWIARRGLDYLHMSDVKAEAILDLDIQGSQQSVMDYFFPLFRYHSRWKELNFYDFDYYNWEHHNTFKGQYTGVSIYQYQWPEGFMEPTDELYELPENSVEYLEKIADLCSEEGVELVLMKAPMDGWTYSRYNSIRKLADEYGVPFVDYNLIENINAIQLDPATDFHYNQWHLRVTGADKLSIHLGEYLTSNYALPDHRGDREYDIWNKDLEAYMELKKEYGIRTPTRNEMIFNEDKLEAPIVKVVNTNQCVELSWQNVEYATIYSIHRGTSPDNMEYYCNSTEPRLVDKNVTANTTYYYTVAALQQNMSGKPVKASDRNAPVFAVAQAS